MKAKRAGLPLAKLLGSHRDSVQCYNTSGGFLHDAARPGARERRRPRASAASAASSSRWASPIAPIDIQRVEAVRKQLGDGFPLMVDANQQWDRADGAAHVPRLRAVQPDLDRGAARCLRRRRPRRARRRARHADRHRRDADQRRRARAADHAARRDFVQPDAPRVGGITPFLQIVALADRKGLQARAALRDGDPRAPRRHLPERAVGRAFRMARAAVQRAPRDPRRAA